MYVSCKQVMTTENGAEKLRVVCTDEAGAEWWIPDPAEECQVGDWLQFIAAGGTVEAYEEQPT